MKKLMLLLLVTGCGQGPQGIPGNNGPIGNTGPSGPAGADGNSITVIQFCPGTSNYPTSFPEIGFCINQEIFAVYSANDGFLTKIPPGSYSSNAIGSACSFNVLANCVIQNW